MKRVVLENSNVEKLASNLYLSVHSLPQEDHYDTDDASAGEVYAILVSESTVCTIQPPRRRQHRRMVKKLETSLTTEFTTLPSPTLRLAYCPHHHAYSGQGRAEQIAGDRPWIGRHCSRISQGPSIKNCCCATS